MADEEYLMGYWDCTQCGATKNRGDRANCPKCGRPRPAGVQFYLPEDLRDAEVVSGDQGLKEAKAGPDKICPYCGASNSALNEVCSQCGGSFSGKVQPTQDYAPGEHPTQGDNAAITPGSRLPGGGPGASAVSAEAPAPRRSRWPGIGGALLAAGLLVLAAFLLLRPRPVQLTVSGLSWERTISYEEYKTVREEDWTVPPGGRLVRSLRAIRSYVSVLDHHETRTRQVPHSVAHTVPKTCTENLGNGRFRSYSCPQTTYTTEYTTESYQEAVYRQDPVYATKYEYDVEKWVSAGTERANGSDHAASWPAALTRSHPVRESGRIEKYVVIFSDSSRKTYNHDMGYREWAGYDLGATIAAQVNGLGGITQIDGR